MCTVKKQKSVNQSFPYILETKKNIAKPFADLKYMKSDQFVVNFGENLSKLIFYEVKG